MPLLLKLCMYRPWILACVEAFSFALAGPPVEVEAAAEAVAAAAGEAVAAASSSSAAATAAASDASEGEPSGVWLSSLI